jgi:hypothetical protein
MWCDGELTGVLDHTTRLVASHANLFSMAGAGDDGQAVLQGIG